MIPHTTHKRIPVDPMAVTALYTTYTTRAHYVNNHKERQKCIKISLKVNNGDSCVCVCQRIKGKCESEEGSPMTYYTLCQ